MKTHLLYFHPEPNYRTPWTALLRQEFPELEIVPFDKSVIAEKWLEDHSPQLAIIHCHDYTSKGERDYASALRLFEQLTVHGVSPDSIVITHTTFGPDQLRKRGFPESPNLRFVDVYSIEPEELIGQVARLLDSAPVLESVQSGS